jgi:hypothetical protein
LQDALDLTNSALRLLEFQRDFIPSAVYKPQYESLLARRRRLLTKLSKALP